MSEPPTTVTRPPDSAPAIAILPWGEVAEDWLAALSLRADEVGEIEQGWIHGFVDCLARAGIRPVLICFSQHTRRPRRVLARRTPAIVWLLPQPRSAALARRCTVDSRRLPARAWNIALRRAAMYLATSPRAVARVLRRERCVSVLCQEYEYPRFDVCVLLGRRLGLPVYGTFQGQDATSTEVERLIRPATMRRASGFMIGSPLEAQRVQQRYGVPSSRIATLGNPVDTSYWRAVDRVAARQAAGVPQDALIVAWHGRVLVEKKGLDLLLAAWGKVVAGAPPGSRQLWLMGDGEDAGRLARMLEALDQRTVRWRAEFVLERDPRRAFLSTADVYALTSRWEGLPVAGLEAMSCGLPVVASPGARPDAFMRLADGRVAGLEVEEDPDQIAAALRRLLDDAELRQRTSAWAREQAETFDSDLIAPRLADFLTGRVP